MSARWDEKNSRKIVKRLVVSSMLTLLTPARFGGGEGRGMNQELTDMPLARDPKDELPLLTGASIAGASRNYLRDYMLGYEEPEPANGSSRAQLLFGDVLESVPDNQKESRESWLIIDDALAEKYQIETRPGVAIDPATRLARVDPQSGRGFLYDMELLEAGTQFKLRFELALPDDPTIQGKLLEGLAVALTGFEKGEIGLGARKRRGLGECKVEDWQVEEYDLKTISGLITWLEGSPGIDKPLPADAEKKPNSRIAAQLGCQLPDDKRRRFTMDASFRLESSLLIRSTSDEPDTPDMVHLKSRRKGVLRPILSGTSLAGAMRGRALRIANTRISDGEKAKKLVDDLFGPEKIESRPSRAEPWASRVVVREREIQGEYERVQSRVKIDRFTGGSFPGALYEQQPVLGKTHSDTAVTLSVELRNPAKEHIGLLLHLLKDLWSGDLPLGGEASVGRGRLRGLQATLQFHSPSRPERGEWRILATSGDGLDIQTLMGKRGHEPLDEWAKSVGGVK